MDIYKFKEFSNYNLIQGVTVKEVNKPYSFSFALHTGEEKSKIDKNRDDFVSFLGKDLNYVLANQVHSDTIYSVTKKENIGWNEVSNIDADALITNLKGVVLSVLTADCVPILLFDKKKEVIAVVHSGWRGTYKEITFKTVERMKKEFNSNPKDILASIAPSIAKCCYEVDEDVAKFFQEGLTPLKDKKFMLDLVLINKNQLIRSGVENIEMSNICTSCNKEKFFSYRKESGCSGRFISFIGLKR